MHISGKIAVFLLLDVALVIILFSMLFCMHPIRLEFISEWIRQCQADRQARVLPILLVITIAFIVLLQLDWMYRVSLQHLQLVAKPEVASVQLESKMLGATRTRIVIKMLACKPKEHIVCVDGHSDAAFMASFAAIVGIAVTVYFSWKSPENWTHYYGVVLFCSGFFCMQQIVWLNLQSVSAVASLRHMPTMSGMHWLVDSAIILFLFVFLILNFVLGRIGPLVVASELLGFALLVFQFLYVFQACCRSSEPLVVQRSAAWGTRLLLCVLLVVPIVLPQLH